MPRVHGEVFDDVEDGGKHGDAVESLNRARLKQPGRDVRLRASEFAGTEQANLTKAELLTRLRATLAEVDDVLARLDPARLLETRTIQGLDGVTMLAAIFHVVEHFSMHTGQIILLTKLRTARDLALYDFTGGIPRPTW